MRHTKWAWRVLACGAALSLGTQALPSAGAEPLARVGEAEISSADLERFRAGLPEPLRDRGSDWLLETLINRELLLQEARRLGLDSTRAVRDGLEQALAARLRDALFERAVTATVQVSEEELLAAYEEGPLAGRSEVRVAHIAVATPREADELLARLAGGAAFADLARAYSLDGRSAAQGGEIGLWREGEVAGPVAERAFSLTVGAVSDPVLDSDGRYHLVKALERRPLGFEGQRDLVENRVTAARVRQRRGEFVDSLLAAYGLDLDEGALADLLRRGRTAVDRLPPAAPGDSARVLVRYRSGRVTVDQYRSWVAAMPVTRRPPGVDRERVADFARTHAVTQRLYPLEARRRGLDRLPELAAWSEHRLGDLMIEELSRVAVEAQVLSEADVAQYYQEHRTEFREPERRFVEVLLAADEAEARRLLDTGAGDGDLAAVAASLSPSDDVSRYRAFSIAEESGDRSDGVPASLVAVARGLSEEAPGPIVARVTAGAGSGGFALVHLVELRPPRQRPLADPEVRRRILESLRRARAVQLEQAFAAFVAGARSRRAADIRYLARSGGR